MTPLGQRNHNGSPPHVDNKHHSEVKVKLVADKVCLSVNESAGVGVWRGFGIWVEGPMAKNSTC